MSDVFHTLFQKKFKEYYGREFNTDHIELNTGHTIAALVAVLALAGLLVTGATLLTVYAISYLFF